MITLVAKTQLSHRARDHKSDRLCTDQINSFWVRRIAMNKEHLKTPLVLLCIFVSSFVVYGTGWLHGRYQVGKSLVAFSWTKVDQSSHPQEEGHDHDHGHVHDETNSIELSDAARKNLGLTDDYLEPIELSTFQRTITVPAIIVDRPGRTRLPVSAAMTGIVTHVHAVSGEAVEPGDLLLEMRLTHEDLVTAQKEFLQSLGERDIEVKEIARIEKLASSGALSNKTLLDRQYSLDKVEALMKSQREALRLHGLTIAQIQSIETDRRLLTEMRVFAPGPDDHNDEEMHLSSSDEPDISKRLRTTFDKPDEASHAPAHMLVLQDMRAQKGQIVNAGDLLCTLADFDELLVEGQAFESESGQITKAKQQNVSVSAVLEESGKRSKIDGLTMGWVDNEIDPTTRTLKFYVLLPNTLLQDTRNATHQRYVIWQYRTGQRMQLQVPVEQWEGQIVLPVDAVAKEGLESYVFQQNGDHFERLSVHELYRDQLSVVLENDGTIFPGDVVARRGAHQLQMALKNKAGGGADPHAGHNH